MKVELEDMLWAKVKRHAEAVGYSSPEEFVQHAVERQVHAAASPENGQDTDKLKGIGYIDIGRDI